VVVGRALIGSDDDFTVIRYKVDGTLDSTSFGRTNFTEGGAAVLVDEGLSLYDSETYGGPYSGGSMLLQRSTGPNGEDSFAMKGALSLLTLRAMRRRCR
jgi:hypothetical protein